MDNITKNQERIDFLKEWKDFLTHKVWDYETDKYEALDKAFQIDNEITSRIYYNTVYKQQQEQELQKQEAQFAHIQKDMGSAIKELRECKTPDEQLDKAKKEILKRFKNGKTTREQMVQDYQTAKGIVAHYAKA